MLEHEIKTYLAGRHLRFEDRTDSHTDLDFHLSDHNLWFDAKEKVQPLSRKNWGSIFGSTDSLFILDDLAARRLLQHAPRSFCLIKDSSQGQPGYYVYSVVDLFCIPKRRVRRPIERNVAAFKGKWLIDLRDAAAFTSLADAVEYLLSYERLFPAIFAHHIDCWGNYATERIETAGLTRTAKFWHRDARRRS